MAKKQKSKAQTLFEKLGAAGTSTNVFTGMIKRANDDDDSIMFARAGDCAKWIKIPADHIEDIKLIHIASCEGHTHPLVHLFMKDPTSADAKSYAALARLHHAPPTFQLSARATPPMVGVAGQPGSTPCYWDWGLNRWICPPS